MKNFLPLLCLIITTPVLAAERLNVLILTVDDMSADSLGAFGCKLPDTSPNIDRLASQGFCFDYAHVQVANCMPSRNVLYSGLYPHNNRVEGFYQVKNPGYPVMADLMKSAGYFTAIRGKVGHSTPYSPYDWDLILDRQPGGGRAEPKNITSYKTSTEQGIAAAKAAGKPFCLVMNVSDPHKPFYSEGGRGRIVDDPNVPSRVFTPEEIPVPGFLFDDPVVRAEIARYYSSVRRADDCVGGVLEALDASGEADRTVILFLSDHGMPLPFAKTQVYHHSTRTPLIVRWPGVTKPTRDRTHMVSAVDFLPTLLDIVGIEHPKKLDGRSFAPILRGETQDDRDMIVKVYNENSGGWRDPMRAIETKKYLYIFNLWSDGKRVDHTATHGTQTYARMKELAKTDSAIAERLALFDHRVPQEFYDVENDPDCRNNLIDDAGHQSHIAKLQVDLEAWMVKTADPMLDVFRHRDDPAARAAFMQQQEKDAAERNKEKRPKAKARRGSRAERAGRRNRAARQLAE
jgi:N-sulfoglucosamine sulfohydrolase